MTAASAAVLAGNHVSGTGGHPSLQRNERLIVGVVILATALIVAIFAHVIAPYDPRGYPAAPLAGPSAQHLLGANDAGQDNLSLLIYGARTSLLVGLLAGIASTAIAWAAGLCSGLSRRADWCMTFVTDLLLAVPPLLLILLLVTYAGSGLTTLIVILGLVSWGAFARVLRGQVQSELRKPYVEAARSLGASRTRLLALHIAPATLPTVAVKFVLAVQYAIVVQASLAFLGLGDPATISWGSIAHRAALSPVVFLSRAWLWWLLPPALAIGILVVGFALIGWAFEDRHLAPPARKQGGQLPQAGDCTPDAT